MREDRTIEIERVIVLNKDFWAGVLFVSFGLAFLLLGLRYSAGSPARMGPGYLPVVVSGLLIAIGSTVIGRSGWRASPAIKVTRFRPLALVLLSVVAFGVLIKPLGLCGAITSLVFISSFAFEKREFAKTAIVSVLLLIFSGLVFVGGLGLHASMFGSVWAGG